MHNNLGQLTQATFNPIQKGDSAFSTFHTFDGYRNQAFHLASGAAPAGMINYELNPMQDNKVPGLAKNSAVTGWNYNANGEATSVGLSVGSSQGLNLTWDSLGRLGRLAAVSGHGANQTYTYGPDGMRVSLTDAVDSTRNRKYIYGLGGMLFSELGNTGYREVIYLGGNAIAEVDAKGIHELHCDHLDTPRLITNGATGNIEGRQLFGPYGESITMADNAYVPLTGYTGHVQTDATGLIYMRGRYYSPAWHRFVNSDHGIDPESINQFAYCVASPFMAIDPSGMAIYNNDREKKGTEITHKDENGNVHHDHGNGKVTTTSKDGKTETHAGAIVEVTAKDPGKSWEPKGPRDRPDRDHSAHSSQGQSQTNAGGYGPMVIPNVKSYVDHPVFGSGTCVDFPRFVMHTPPTSTWMKGPQPDVNTPIGTLVATFYANGGTRFANRSGFSHVGAWGGLVEGGIAIYDQYRGKELILRSTIFYGGTRNFNSDAHNYHIVLFPRR